MANCSVIEPQLEKASQLDKPISTKLQANMMIFAPNQIKVEAVYKYGGFLDSNGRDDDADRLKMTATRNFMSPPLA